MATLTGASISITASDDLLLRNLQKLAEAPDTTPLMYRMGEYFEDSTKQRFKTQVGPDGSPWKPLSPGYIKRKKQNQTLILTLNGYLRGYIAHQVLSSSEVAWGSNRIYAAIQQWGGTIDQAAQSRRQRFHLVDGKTRFAGRQHENAAERWVERGAYQIEIPARPYLGVSAADNAEVLAIVQDWLHRKMNGLPD